MNATSLNDGNGRHVTRSTRPNRSRTPSIARAAIAVVGSLALAACNVPSTIVTNPLGLPPSITYFPTPTPPVTPTPIPTPTPAVRYGAIDGALPGDARIALTRAITSAGLQIATGATPPTAVAVRYGIEVPGPVVLTRTYALVAPFPTVPDGVSLGALRSFWSGDGAALAGATNANTAPTLYVDLDTRQALAAMLRAQPGTDARVVVTESARVAQATFTAQGPTLAIVPFGMLDPRWKVLAIDGASLLDKATDMGAYPLVLRVREQLQSPSARTLAPANTDRDVSKLAVVAMTGVTALVRGTAVQMESKGVFYPGAKVRDWLRTADVAHISNEVSFVERCPRPTLRDGTVMCSNPKYIDLLKDMGTDVIELTGNHLWDYGWQNLLPTLDTYTSLGWGYFGGGRNLADSLKPLTMTVNGNRIAFVGCNWFGSNWATERLAGSAPCGSADPRKLDYIVPTIQRLRQEGYLVIATLQYEEYYRYETTQNQVRDFRALRDAGAVVVNGSQGHHVQGFDVTAGGFIHYGTGNFFFGDQTFSRGTLQTFVDRHAFYDGKYIGTDLRSAFIEDLSQPRPMTQRERTDLLATLFRAGYFSP